MPGKTHLEPFTPSECGAGSNDGRNNLESQGQMLLLHTARPLEMRGVGGFSQILWQGVGARLGKIFASGAALASGSPTRLWSGVGWDGRRASVDQLFIYLTGVFFCRCVYGALTYYALLG